ncbi:MAG: lysylphosphatidylglycerol synthase transmembrane domain-containing protein [Gemmatimonadaceae bacterium]
MRFGWRGALGLALSVALLIWALRGVDPGDVWRELGAANPALLLASACVATITFPVRAMRWRSILEPVAPAIAFGPLWRATAIGMMVNNVVPARAGELARAFALTREVPRVSFSASFASLAVDRLFDALVLLLLLLVAMLDPAFADRTSIGDDVAGWVGWAMLIAALFLAVLYCIVLFPAWIVSLYEAFARRVAPRFEERGRALILSFATGLGVLRSPRRFAVVLGWALAHWLLNALAFWIGFRAVGIGAPFTAALFLQGIIAIGVALPSSPGFFGVFEAFAKTGLAVYGVGATEAVSWAIGFHLLSFVPITVIGAYYFTRLGLHFRELREAEEGAGERR